MELAILAGSNSASLKETKTEVQVLIWLVFGVLGFPLTLILIAVAN